MKVDFKGPTHFYSGDCNFHFCTSHDQKLLRSFVNIIKAYRLLSIFANSWVTYSELWIFFLFTSAGCCKCPRTGVVGLCFNPV